MVSLALMCTVLTNMTTDCFQNYPNQPYQDTTTLTKPSHATDWLHFSSQCSHRLHHQQEWDLAPYLSYPVLGFHNLFASNNTHAQEPANPRDAAVEAAQPHPLATNRADSHAHESLKANTATLAKEKKMVREAVDLRGRAFTYSFLRTRSFLSLKAQTSPPSSSKCQYKNSVFFNVAIDSSGPPVLMLPIVITAVLQTRTLPLSLSSEKVSPSILEVFLSSLART